MTLDPVLVQTFALMDQWRPIIVSGADFGPWELGPWQLDGAAYRPTGVVAATVRVIAADGAILATGTATVSNEGDDPSQGLNELAISIPADQTALIPPSCTGAVLEIRVQADAEDEGHAIARFPARIAPSSLAPEPTP